MKKIIMENWHLRIVFQELLQGWWLFNIEQVSIFHLNKILYKLSAYSQHTYNGKTLWLNKYQLIVFIFKILKEYYHPDDDNNKL